MAKKDAPLYSASSQTRCCISGNPIVVSIVPGGWGCRQILVKREKTSSVTGGDPKVGQLQNSLFYLQINCHIGSCVCLTGSFSVVTCRLPGRYAVRWRHNYTVDPRHFLFSHQDVPSLFCRFLFSWPVVGFVVVESKNPVVDPGCERISVGLSRRLAAAFTDKWREKITLSYFPSFRWRLPLHLHKKLERGKKNKMTKWMEFSIRQNPDGITLSFFAFIYFYIYRYFLRRQVLTTGRLFVCRVNCVNNERNPSTDRYECTKWQHVICYGLVNSFAFDSSMFFITKQDG